jgi:hypothetical protein
MQQMSAFQLQFWKQWLQKTTLTNNALIKVFVIAVVASLLMKTAAADCWVGLSLVLICFILS